ncbi:MAG TPA: riboflavin synthase [Candidatus Agrococcus pullicola]|uniref:Riboflavin synthase n=1 Tax=Candidatus Agrococcus pullicola TaxID=2838429 RepID=A0A9D1YWR3_9MICO|nr:riboflavin synthase [Candidatus Agrococcus pullicola]
MFTGIIEEIGEIVAFEREGAHARVTVHGPLSVSDASHGDSIAVNGMCLTVVDHTEAAFTAFVMGVSLETGALGDLRQGSRVNLERAAAVGDRLGGHIVQGHVDGTAVLLSVDAGSDWHVYRFSLNDDIAQFVARKGSIAVQGVSLTVSDLSEATASEPWFEVSLIPETLTATVLGELQPGDRVNIETDVFARHVARMLELNEAREETP